MGLRIFHRETKVVAPRGATVYFQGFKRKMEVLFVEEQTNVTFGQLMDLLDPGRCSVSKTIRVILPDGHGVEGATASGVWGYLEDRAVVSIVVDHGVLLVWLREAAP